MRTFVAVEIPDEQRRRIQKLVNSLRRAPADIRWSRPEGLHITLKFLGEVAEEKIDAVKAAVASIGTMAPITITISEAGFFPNERSPRILWLGIRGAELKDLAAVIDQRLAPLGFATEKRPFSAHLTLGRFRGANGSSALREAIRQFEPLEMGSFVASEFFLYQSQLAAGGSIYKKLARFPLNTP